MEKQTLPLAEKRGKYIAKEHAKWNGRNLWLLKILLHFGRTPVLIKPIHSPTPRTCPQSIFKEMLYSFPHSGWAQT